MLTLSFKYTSSRLLYTILIRLDIWISHDTLIDRFKRKRSKGGFYSAHATQHVEKYISMNEDSQIIFAGCNAGSRNDSIAYRLANVTNSYVYAADESTSQVKWDGSNKFYQMTNSQIAAEIKRDRITVDRNGAYHIQGKPQQTGHQQIIPNK